MQKIIVETKGSFMLNDLGGAQVVEPNRPTVVLQTPFMDKRVNARQLKNYGEVPDTASDEDMAKLWTTAQEDGSEDEFRKSMVEMFNDKNAVKDALEANSRDSKPKRRTKAQKEADEALEAAEKELKEASTDEAKAAAQAKVDAAKQAVEAANK